MFANTICYLHYHFQFLAHAFQIPNAYDNQK